MRHEAAFLAILLLCACARPVPPPATPADTCAANSERQTGVFVVEHGDPPAGPPVMRYVLSTAGAQAVVLEVEEHLLEPFGGATGLNGKRVLVGLERAADSVRVRTVCSITIL